MSYIIKGIENPIKVPIDQLPKLDNPPVYIKVVNINDWVPTGNNKYSVDIPQNIHGLKSPYWILSIETINANKSMISNDTCSYILSNTGTITIISDIKTTIRVTIMGSSMDPQEYIIKVSDDIINKQNKMEVDISAIQQNAVTTDQILDIITGGEDPSQLTPEKILQNLLGGKTLLDIQYPVGSIYMSTSSTNPSTIMGGTWIAWGSGRVPVGVDTTDSDFKTAEKTGGSKELQEHSHTFTPKGTLSNQDTSHTHTVNGGSCDTGSTASKMTLRQYKVNGTETSTYKYLTNSGSDSANISLTGLSHSHTVPNHTHTVGNQSASHKHTFTGTQGTTSNAGTGNSGNLQPYITCYMWKRTL